MPVLPLGSPANRSPPARRKPSGGHARRDGLNIHLKGRTSSSQLYCPSSSIKNRRTPVMALWPSRTEVRPKILLSCNKVTKEGNRRTIFEEVHQEARIQRRNTAEPKTSAGSAALAIPAWTSLKPLCSFLKVHQQTKEMYADTKAIHLAIASPSP